MTPEDAVKNQIMLKAGELGLICLRLNSGRALNGKVISTQKRSGSDGSSTHRPVPGGDQRSASHPKGRPMLFCGVQGGQGQATNTQRCTS